jgi:hypothetical protein
MIRVISKVFNDVKRQMAKVKVKDRTRNIFVVDFPNQVFSEALVHLKRHVRPNYLTCLLQFIRIYQRLDMP